MKGFPNGVWWRMQAEQDLERRGEVGDLDGAHVRALVVVTDAELERAKERLVGPTRPGRQQRPATHADAYNRGWAAGKAYGRTVAAGGAREASGHRGSTTGSTRPKQLRLVDDW